MLVKAAIFDCDGVIIDSFREGLRRIKMLCAIHEVRYTLQERRHLTEIWGLPGIELLVQGLGISRALAEAMHHHWEKIDLQEPPPYVPGARDVLYWMRRNEFKSVLLTSRHRENLTAILDRKDLLGEFAFLSTRDDFYYSKPDPRAFRFSLEKLRDDFGIEKESCVFVGDTPADIQGGANAGIRTVIAQTGPYLLEHSERHPVALQDVIPSLDEFPSWIEKHHEGKIAFSYY